MNLKLLNLVLVIIITLGIALLVNSVYSKAYDEGLTEGLGICVDSQAEAVEKLRLLIEYKYSANASDYYTEIANGSAVYMTTRKVNLLDMNDED